MIRELIDTALWAHTNLATFESVVALLEGGVHKGTSANKSAQKIIKICLEEECRQLGVLDKAKAKLASSAPSAPQGESK